jgi:hypothetical protein
MIHFYSKWNINIKGESTSLPDPLSVYSERAIICIDAAIWVVSLLASGEGDQEGGVGINHQYFALDFST